MERLFRKVFYRFMVVLAWIFGWPILLMLEIKERLPREEATRIIRMLIYSLHHQDERDAR
jgi:hypothetical protein